MTQDVCFTPLDTPTEKLLLDDYLCSFSFILA